MKRLLREPLLLFIVIGLGFFMLRIWITNSTEPETKRITVSTDQVEQMSSEFNLTWMRPPTESEMEGIINDFVRNEVYYREALALGLDKNDLVVRRRLRQKMELIMDDLNAVGVPSDQVLTTFLQEHADIFQLEPQVSFEQVYLSPDLHLDMEADAKNMLASLRAGAAPETLSDPTLVGYEYTLATQSEIARFFGNAFARQVVELEPGVWLGPLYSGLGGQLVRVSERRDGRLPALAEVREQVEREWLALKRKELKNAAYGKLLEGYEVVIERAEDKE